MLALETEMPAAISTLVTCGDTSRHVPFQEGSFKGTGRRKLRGHAYAMHWGGPAGSAGLAQHRARRQLRRRMARGTAMRARDAKGLAAGAAGSVPALAVLCRCARTAASRCIADLQQQARTGAGTLGWRVRADADTGTRRLATISSWLLPCLPGKVPAWLSPRTALRMPACRGNKQSAAADAHRCRYQTPR